MGNPGIDFAEADCCKLPLMRIVEVSSSELLRILI
jgi:hypothetical protein